MIQQEIEKVEGTFLRIDEALDTCFASRTLSNCQPVLLQVSWWKQMVLGFLWVLLWEG